MTPNFIFNDTATTEIYTLSLHDALPIFPSLRPAPQSPRCWKRSPHAAAASASSIRSEEHTSELQSRGHLVCRLLLEKKKENNNNQQVNQQKKSYASHTRDKPKSNTTAS